MKKKGAMLVMALMAFVFTVQAQRVSVRLSFPGHYHTRAYGRPPITGDVWIGPEWEWRGGRYVAVPGYWTRPVRYGAVWVPGHWEGRRRNYRWIPGHWRY